MRFVMPTGSNLNPQSELMELSRSAEYGTYDAPFGRTDSSSSSGSASMYYSCNSGQGYIYSNITPDAPNCTQMEIKDLVRSKWGERENYQQIKQIGSGSYGSCVLLKRRSDSALRVCKVTERFPAPNGEGPYEAEPLEAKILKDILPPHDRICRLYESIVQPRTVQLYFDYYSGGDLSNIIRLYEYNWEMLPETFLWHAFIQLAEALAFMHSGYNKRSLCAPPGLWRPVFHGDIKPANIFLSPPNPNSEDPLCRLYPSLVLGDFGMSSLTPAASYGTLKYQPPEMPAVSGPSDVWSAGCVLHALAHYDAPVAPLPDGIPDTQENMMEWLTFYPQSRDPLPLYEAYTMELHDCVFEAFERDPRGRISSLDLYKKVLDVYKRRIEPHPSVLPESLVDCDYRGKMYDENGVTLHTGDARPVNIKIVQDSETTGMEEARDETNRDEGMHSD